MPYQSNEELPDSVKNHLSGHAQDIFREAFNSSYKKYKNSKTRRDSTSSREEVAYKIAWSAVKKKYHKNEATGKWIEN